MTFDWDIIRLQPFQGKNQVASIDHTMSKFDIYPFDYFRNGSAAPETSFPKILHKRTGKKRSLGQQELLLSYYIVVCNI